MKKKQLLFITLMFTLLGHLSSNAETIVFNQTLTESEAKETPYVLEINHDKANKTIEINFTLNALFLDDDPLVAGAKVCYLPDFTSANEPGMPVLPSKTLKYNLPTCDSVEINYANVETAYINCTISPNQEGITSYQITDHLITEVINYSGYYPSTFCGQSDIQFLRGAPIHYLTISPVQYSVQEKKIKVTKSFKAVISYNEGIADLENHRSPAFKASREKILDKICSGGVWEASDAKPYPEESTEDYLIISSVWLSGAIDTLADWKRTMGYRVEMVLKENFTWQEMRDTINHYYDNLDNLTNVLIVGGHGAFPGIPFDKIGCKIKDVHNDAISYSAYAYQDPVKDYEPRFCVGRVYINNRPMLRDFTHKLRTYESTPTTDPTFYKNLFLTGRFDPIGADGCWEESKYDSIPAKTYHEEEYAFIQGLEKVRQWILKNSNNVNARRIYAVHPAVKRGGKIVYPSNFTTRRQDLLSYDTIPFPDDLKYPNYAWDGGMLKIQESLEEGSFLGIYCSHGNSDGWFTLDFYPNDYKVANIGTRYPLLLSISCGTGMNQWNGSFANHLISYKEGPIALIASSEVSHVHHNYFMMESMVKDIFPDKQADSFNKNLDYRIGQLLNRSLEYADNKAYKSIYQRRTYCCYGDPSVDFNTDVPIPFNAPFIQGCGTDVYVDLNGENYEDGPIRLHFRDNETGKVESYDYVGPNYYFTASNKSTDVEVAITGHNRYPYFETVDVSYGESFIPKFDGTINGFKYDRSTGQLTLNLSLSGAVSCYRVRFVGSNNVAQGFDVVDAEFDSNESCVLNVGSDFSGIFQIQLICDTILLDTFRGIIE